MRSSPRRGEGPAMRVRAGTAASMAVVVVGALGAAIVGLPASAATPKVLRVGTWHGIRGTYTSIQAAVDAAHAGDWGLVGPGDWKERGDFTTHKPAKGEA